MLHRLFVVSSLLFKCCITSILISTVWLSLDLRLLEKQHRLISGRVVCVYVSEVGIRQVNLQRLQRAPAFILLPQVSKRELPVSALVMVWTVFLFFSEDVCVDWRVRLVLEDITVRQAVL